MKGARTIRGPRPAMDKHRSTRTRPPRGPAGHESGYTDTGTGTGTGTGTDTGGTGEPPCIAERCPRCAGRVPETGRAVR